MSNPYRTDHHLEKLPSYAGREGLTPGCMDEEHFLLLMDISPICSKKVFESLRAYLVDGRSRKFVCENYNINNGYLTVSLNRLNKIHKCVLQLKKYYQ
ncbi:adhesin biosynthesis transcription regulatory family protein [Escherichia coli]|uniref:adhesin biosynthesis transcription regulatory family protein n=1 Tax=Escherichia coli TaxID=562 RepID=UPI001436B964|nr:adhesin biosynthesis transcription regulatory family protein [Escherichia coli]EHK6112920.1 adhesin biosynthesis transcription regulatory family protein [Escherichia coli]EHK7382498.1 adhesin biosynthesis transcription regulatory family protein [Escherichia coli]EIC6439119.1 adhesin biosynthesis transcription regulatory family protein [Escherichia coli]EIG2154544.1 adhesin biosynthesis transcription regulatory family protein [Escherichia coli]EIG8377665.1 adhesin biosynthesis transcription 